MNANNGDSPINTEKNFTSDAETILLVEDEENIREFIKEILEDEGYNILDAAHGSAAAKIIENYPDEIDLLLSDIKMPDISGRDVAKILHKKHPNAKILFISGFTEDKEILRDISEKKAGFLQKPFTYQTLLNSVIKMFG